MDAKLPEGISLMRHPTQWFKLGDLSFVFRQDILPCIEPLARQEVDSNLAAYYRLKGSPGNYTILPVTEGELTSRLSEWHKGLLSKQAYLQHIGSTHVPIPELHEIDDPRV